ncbi:MAG: siderophore-iron reductase FhuF, partial [Hansschlegelia sp.]
STIAERDVDALRTVGLSDNDIADVVFAAAARSFFAKVLDGVGVNADDQGRTRQIVLPEAGGPFEAAEDETRFDALVDGHLTPLIDALATIAGCSPKVFWSNAGNVFEYVIASAGGLGADPRAVEAGVALMAGRRRRGRSNPLFAPISYPPDGRRVRRVCCLRYFAPDVGYCGTCPISQDPHGGVDRQGR